jgi:hypothetical protein
MLRALLLALIISGDPIDVDPTSPLQVLVAMTTCVPIVTGSVHSDGTVEFHVDTPLPSGGTLIWSAPDLDEARWELYRQPQHPKVVLRFAQRDGDPDTPMEQEIRANRDRIAACFTSLTF